MCYLRRLLLPAAMLLLVLLSACSSSGSDNHQSLPRVDPLDGVKFYVSPNSSSTQGVERLADQGHRRDAELVLDKIANVPTAVWFTGPDPALQVRVRLLVERAAAADRMPVLVAYYIPHRDCGSYSAGGAGSAAAYRSWIHKIAEGIGANSATVILEPDALPAVADHCLPAEQASERMALLHDAVSALKANPKTIVYIDAGNAGWKQPEIMAEKLRQADIAEADGFSVNVSNFRTTQESIAYGSAISKMLDGIHFVIDTSRNGNGPLSNDPDGLEWCNPPGRALGQAPTSATGKDLVDAFLWVKQPGESDGSCRPGAPPAGQWWTPYAVELARNTP